MNLKKASLIGLSIAGLLAGAPAMSDTYTGCLTPGGTITHVAPGDTPRVGICPTNHMEITLGGAGGSGGFSDWEIVWVGPKTLELGPAGNEDAAGTLDADCPDGKKPLGGGGVPTSSTLALSTSAPYDDANGAGWEVTFYNTLDEARFTNASVYAICATVD